VTRRRPPVWIELPTLHRLHDRLVERFGGATGVLSEPLLLSALHRPVDKWLYERAALPACAAAYLWGITHAHGYVDGNKRTSLMAALAFLRVNGRTVDVANEELFALALAAARKRVTERQVAAWFRLHSRRQRN
jgi:death-on-curing protein